RGSGPNILRHDHRASATNLAGTNNQPPRVSGLCLGTPLGSDASGTRVGGHASTGATAFRTGPRTEFVTDRHLPADESCGVQSAPGPTAARRIGRDHLSESSTSKHRGGAL